MAWLDSMHQTPSYVDDFLIAFQKNSFIFERVMKHLMEQKNGNVTHWDKSCWESIKSMSP